MIWNFRKNRKNNPWLVKSPLFVPVLEFLLLVSRLWFEHPTLRSKCQNRQAIQMDLSTENCDMISNDHTLSSFINLSTFLFISSLCNTLMSSHDNTYDRRNRQKQYRILSFSAVYDSCWTRFISTILRPYFIVL